MGAPDAKHPIAADFPAAWAVVPSPSRVRVAVVDTGVNAVSELQGLVESGYCVPKCSDTTDHNGHGTAVASIVAAPQDKVGIVGAARGPSTIVPVRVSTLAVDTPFTGQSVFYFLQVGVELAAERGARVINVSVAGDGDEDERKTWSAVVADAEARGSLVVAGAGNGAEGVQGDGWDTEYLLNGSRIYTLPAMADGVVAVGGLTPDGRVDAGSNFGSQVLLYASWRAIVMSANGGSWLWAQGTSVSTPIVSGAAALLFAIRPVASPADVRQALIDGGREGIDWSQSTCATATGRMHCGSEVQVGKMLDLSGALARFQTPVVSLSPTPMAAPTPTATATPAPTPPPTPTPAPTPSPTPTPTKPAAPSRVLAALEYFAGVCLDPFSGKSVSDPNCLRVTLTWSDQSDNEDGFRIYRAFGGEPAGPGGGCGEPTLVAKVQANVTQYVESLRDVSLYCWWVASFNQVGRSALVGPARYLFPPTEGPTPAPSPTPAVSAPTPTASLAPTAIPSTGPSYVTIHDFAFHPAIVTISPGDSVTWTQMDPTFHTVTSCTIDVCPAVSDVPFDSGVLKQGDKFTFTFVSPGTYRYYCRVHGYSAMHATVVVG